MQLDTVTAFVFATLIMLLNGGVLGTVHSDLQESLRPSALRWRLGTLVIACGCVCLGVQRYLPPGFILPLANGLIMAGLTLYWLALRRFDGRDEPWWTWVPMAVGTFAVFWFSQVQPNLVARVVLVSLVWVLLLAVSTAALWRVPQETVAASRRVLSTIFVGLATVMLARALWFISGTGNEQTILDNGSWVNLATPMVAAALPITGTTAFLMLCSERLRRELERLATTDVLTGLANRRTLTEQGEASVTARRALAVAMLDVDHFKSVNDRHGHAVGDVALKHVATQLRANSRPGDLPARQGGEEFVMLFDAPDVEAARAVAERLREAIAAMPVSVDALTLPLTVSVGVTLLSSADKTFDELLRRADEALYRAKSNGRNRVEVS